MSLLSLLDDQPSATKDALYFSRYIQALEQKVLNRSSYAPLVIGIFGAWGSGKTTLLEMIEHKLKQPETQGKWIVVRFSPWLYANEKSLLLPLLATLAAQQPAFEKLVKSILKVGPGLLKVLTGGILKGLGIVTETAATGLPLLTFLHSLHTEKEKAKDLQEQIADAVKTATQGDKKLVFLIDDLDRCHDQTQIVNLLEQIKLFLHLDNCLFLIAADRSQIIKAINHKFPNSGEAYLEKFVQLAFELPPHNSQYLVDILNLDETQKTAFRALSELMGNNPRKLKRLWNEAIFLLDVLKEEQQRVSGFSHQPRLELVLKWLLLKSCGNLDKNPYHYLKFEKVTESPDQTKQLQNEFIHVLQFKDSQRNWRSEEHRRLAVYLWHDRLKTCFETGDILSLYARVSGEHNSHSRLALEEACFDGSNQAIFSYNNFKDTNLSNGHFQGAEFTHCDFTRADLSHTDLTGVQFKHCIFEDTCFDQAIITGSSWENCKGLEHLDAEPILYREIVRLAIEKWKESDQPKWEQNVLEGFFKAYKTILDRHNSDQTLSETLESNLRAEGKDIRQAVLKRLS